MEPLSLLLSVCREEAEPRGKAKFSCFSRRRPGSTVGLWSLEPEVPEAAGKAAVNLSHGNVVAGNDFAKQWPANVRRVIHGLGHTLLHAHKPLTKMLSSGT